jgi:hypothetical protein
VEVDDNDVVGLVVVERGVDDRKQLAGSRRFAC